MSQPLISRFKHKIREHNHMLHITLKRKVDSHHHICSSHISLGGLNVLSGGGAAFPGDVDDLSLLLSLLRHFRNTNPQHPILQTRLYLLQVSVPGQAELAPELPGGPLRPVPLLAVDLFLRLPLAAYPQHPVLLHLYLHVLLLHPGDVERDHVLPRGLLPVGTCEGQRFRRFRDRQRRLLQNPEGIFRREHQIKERRARVRHERLSSRGEENQGAVVVPEGSVVVGGQVSRILDTIWNVHDVSRVRDDRRK
nr:Pectinesterase/pectinesterase inhibitor PPE8B [Ipomoea batatas]